MFADPVPATGTGTLVIELQDVNDNGPVIDEREFNMCNREALPVILPVTDKDGPGFGAPFSVELQGDGKINWTARMNDSSRLLLNYKALFLIGVKERQIEYEWMLCSHF